MYKTFTVILLMAIICLKNANALAGQKLRVYFVGNSYTYTNDMPKMIADIATSMGDTLEYESHTPGGATLKSHWNPPADPCVIKIKTGNWDYVILQEQSQMPAFDVLNPSHPTYIYAGQFTKLIRDSAKCATAMFYMTWGYKNGDASSCPGMPAMCTYEGMDSTIRARYLELADSFYAVVSPVGAVRRYIRTNHPGIELYQPDGSHPEVAGTYAAACCFYAALFKKDPSFTTFNSSLSAADASNIKNAAKTVAFDSLAKWGIGVYDLSAAYDFAISGTQVTFTNKSSLKMQTYNWDFGDGNTSILKNPIHTYTVKGDYTVTLTAYDANGCSKTISRKVNMLPIGIYPDAGHTPFAIYPNPATESITIQVPQKTGQCYIRITNAMGQTMYQAPANSELNKIDISAFSNGMYCIKLYSNTTVYHYDKFIKQ